MNRTVSGKVSNRIIDLPGIGEAERETLRAQFPM